MITWQRTGGSADDHMMEHILGSIGHYLVAGLLHILHWPPASVMHMYDIDVMQYCIATHAHL